MPLEKNNAVTATLPVVLRARILPLLLLLSVALISVGVAVSTKERYMELALIAVIAGMIGLLQHFPGLSTLTLNDKGFIVKTIFGTRVVAWHAASNFRPTKRRRIDLVMWDEGDAATRSSRARTQIFAYWAQYDATTLAALMNQIRQQAVGASAEHPVS